MVELCSSQSTWLSQGSSLLISGLWSTVVCVYTSMHSSHSSPPGWKSAGCLREVIELFPQYSQPEKRKWGRKKILSQENTEVHSGLACNTADTETWYRLCLDFLEVKLHKNTSLPPPSKWPHSPCRTEKFVTHFTISARILGKLLPFPYWGCLPTSFLCFSNANNSNRQRWKIFRSDTVNSTSTTVWEYCYKYRPRIQNLT